MSFFEILLIMCYSYYKIWEAKLCKKWIYVTQFFITIIKQLEQLTSKEEMTFCVKKLYLWLKTLCLGISRHKICLFWVINIWIHTKLWFFFSMRIIYLLKMYHYLYSMDNLEPITLGFKLHYTSKKPWKND